MRKTRTTRRRGNGGKACQYCRRPEPPSPAPQTSVACGTMSRRRTWSTSRARDRNAGRVPRRSSKGPGVPARDDGLEGVCANSGHGPNSLSRTCRYRSGKAREQKNELTRRHAANSERDRGSRIRRTSSGGRQLSSPGGGTVGAIGGDDTGGGDTPPAPPGPAATAVRLSPIMSACSTIAAMLCCAWILGLDI
jgi:hypothetical protein